MTPDDYIGCRFQVINSRWWTDHDYSYEKKWGELVGCESEPARAECIGILWENGSSYLIMQSYTGESKGYYCWLRRDQLTMLSALEQLAEAAE